MNRSIATRTMRVISLLLVLLAGAGNVCGAGLIYEIRRDDAAVGYLVGTMHSEDPRVMAVLDTVQPLLKRVDTLAVELVPDAVTMVAVAAASMLPVDQRLQDVIGSARYTALRAAAARLGLPEAALMRLKPWAAALTLATPPVKTGIVLDVAIYLQAADRGLRVLGLESAAEQLAVFQQMPLSEQLELLDEMIKNAPDLPLQLEELVLAYLSGDPQQLTAVVGQQHDQTAAAIAHWFDEVLLRQRNHRMLQRILPLLGEGTVMIAVGALHLLGESGLVSTLRAQGYDVELWKP